MKLTITRSISALAVTGALVLTGAGAAQAHGDHDGHRGDGDRSSFSSTFRGDDDRGDSRDGDRRDARHGDWRGYWGDHGRSADHRQDADHRPPPADVPPPVDDTADDVTFDELTPAQQRLFLKLVGEALSDGVFDQDDLSTVVQQFEEQTGVDLTLA